MIVCLCRGVSCGAVRRAVGAGAQSIEEIGDACGAGTDCGACHAQLELLLAEATEEAGVANTGVRLPMYGETPMLPRVRAA